MLPDSPEVEEVVLGNESLLEGVQRGALFIDMSTIAPSTAKKLYELFSEKGCRSPRRTSIRRAVGAEAASLSIMVGGSEQAFQQAMPVLKSWAKTCAH
jgi:2-hydroxy-3-oxopropionate reductase